MSQTISSWLNRAETKLKLSGIDSYRSDARQLIKYLADLSDQQIISGDELLNDAQVAKLKSSLDRRLEGEPLAYILGFKDFFGQAFSVDNRVLIPRPETENLVEYILSLKLNQPKILDVGTGSGAIGLSLAINIKGSDLVLSDLKDDALAVAKINQNKFFDQLKLSKSTVEIVKSDLLSAVSEQKFDIIVANLPYVSLSWNWLNMSSLSFEPSSALFAEEGGLSLIKALLHQAKPYLKPSSQLVLELDPSQKPDLNQFAQELGYRSVDSSGYGDYIVAFKLI